MFGSLDAFRAHCGEPAMPLEHCAICRAMPERCRSWHNSSLVADFEVDYGDAHGGSDVPPQADELEVFFAGSEQAVMRCPTCRRLYLYTCDTSDLGALISSSSSYQRLAAAALFCTPWAVSRRLPDREVQAAREFFGHALVRFAGSSTWFSLDAHNRLVALGEGLARVIASEPPRVLDDVTRARAYAQFVGEIEDPAVHVIDSFTKIRWRDPLTQEDRQGIEAARTASRVEALVTERTADQIVVRFWVVSKQRLICRIVTVRASGETLREDAVIAQNLPVASTSASGSRP